MRLVKTTLGWMTLSGEMWDEDEVYELLASQSEGTMLRLVDSDLVSDEDDYEDS